MPTSSSAAPPLIDVATATIASNQDATRLAVRDARVFWATLDAIRTANAGAVIDLAPVQGEARDLVLGGDHAFWCELDPNAFTGTAQERLRAVSYSGTGLTTIATGSSMRVALKNGLLYWSNYRSGIVEIHRAPETDLGHDELIFASSGSPVSALAVTDSFIYWHGLGRSETLYRIPVTGAASADSLWPHASVDAQELKVTGDALVFRSSDGPTYRAPLDGGDIVQVASAVFDEYPSALDVLGQFVYWTQSKNDARGSPYTCLCRLGPEGEVNLYGGPAPLIDVSADPSGTYAIAGYDIIRVIPRN